MPDDLLPHDDPPNPPTPAAPGRRERVRCEFCESSLTPTGDVLVLGARARKLRDLEESASKHETIAAELRRQVDDLKTKLAVATDATSRRDLIV